MRKKIVGVLLVTLLVASVWPQFVQAEAKSRIKDLAILEGTTPEPITGFGLVTGLSGTGDGQSSEFTINSVASMLERFGVTVEPNQLKLKNVAAVLVSAELGPGASVGTRLDVTVESFGDASSLEGGRLLMTPLLASDGTPCVIAQGSISIGGFNIRSGSNNSFRKNHATVGMIPNGGTVRVRIRESGFYNEGRVAWLLHSPDFNTAFEVASAINKQYGTKLAHAADAQRIEVQVPEKYSNEPVAFVAVMGDLASSSDAPARVVINERTGTIIVGENVVLSEAAVAHGNLKVVVKTFYDVSQPSSFNSSGETVVVPDVNTDVQDHEAHILHVPETSTVADVVTVLNDIGASPRDIIAILQALKQAGALRAELKIM